MSADGQNLATGLRGSAASIDSRRDLRRRWTVITSLIAVAVLVEAIFAGAMLSGVGWALAAHSVTAGILIASALAAGLASVVTLRRVSGGRKLGFALLSLAGVFVLQAAAGVLTAKGVNLLWIHVPLGVGLFGFARQAAMGARGLGEE